MSKAVDVVEMPDQLTAFDALMHRGEANPRTRSGIMAIQILESAPDWRRFRDLFDNASRRVPRMRQKVVTPTLPTTAARWVVDPDFNLDFHIRRSRVPAPGELRDVLDMAELMVQAPLDISRPLWSVTLVEDLTHGRAAVLLHMSHAVTDGVGSIAMFEQIFDLEADAAERPIAPLPVPVDMTANDLMREGVSRLPATLVRQLGRTVTGAAHTLAKVITQPVSTTTTALDYLRSGSRLMTPPAPPSPLLRRRSLASRTECLDMPLAALQVAAKKAGGSLNDAYLAALCGALRRYHDAMGIPVATLPMAIPVSLRTEGDPAGGNRFTGVTLAAPIAASDPVTRINNIHAQMVMRREDAALDVVSVIAPIMNVLPEILMEAMAGSFTPADVQASNVPGFPGTIYLAGSKVLRQYGLGPLPGIAMMVSLVSLGGVCTVSVRYDCASITDKDLFARCLEEGFDEVLILAGMSAARATVTSLPASD
jgi:diacylglycerol O-acyltransferase / wax synthase